MAPGTDTPPGNGAFFNVGKGTNFPRTEQDPTPNRGWPGVEPIN